MFYGFGQGASMGIRDDETTFYAGSASAGKFFEYDNTAGTTDWIILSAEFLTDTMPRFLIDGVAQTPNGSTSGNTFSGEYEGIDYLPGVSVADEMYGYWGEWIWLDASLENYSGAIMDAATESMISKWL